MHSWGFALREGVFAVKPTEQSDAALSDTAEAETAQSHTVTVRSHAKQVVGGTN